MRLRSCCHEHRVTIVLRVEFDWLGDSSAVHIAAELVALRHAPHGRHDARSHNEGANVLQERLDGKAEVDHDTARRLFTLICVLHFGG